VLVLNSLELMGALGRVVTSRLPRSGLVTSALPSILDSLGGVNTLGRVVT